MKEQICFNNRLLENMEISEIVALRDYCDDLIVEKKEELGKKYVEKIHALIEEAYKQGVFLNDGNNNCLFYEKITYTIDQ